MAVDSKDGGQQLKKPYHPLFLSVNVGQLRKPCQKILHTVHTVLMSLNEF